MFLAVGEQRTVLTDCRRIAPDLSVSNPPQAVCERAVIGNNAELHYQSLFCGIFPFSFAEV